MIAGRSTYRSVRAIVDRKIFRNQKVKRDFETNSLAASSSARDDRALLAEGGRPFFCGAPSLILASTVSAPEAAAPPLQNASGPNTRRRRLARGSGRSRAPALGSVSWLLASKPEAHQVKAKSSREQGRLHRRDPLAEKMCSRPQPARHKREYEGFLERILHRGELTSRASRRSHKRDAKREDRGMHGSKRGRQRGPRPTSRSRRDAPGDREKVK